MALAAQESITSGATINTAFISGQGLNGPTGLALDANNHLFVVSVPIVGQYNATTGATLNPTFVDHQGLTIPIGIVLDRNSRIFVANAGNGTVGEYNATTGATVNATFINGQGLTNPEGLARKRAGAPPRGGRDQRHRGRVRRDDGCND